MIIAETRNEKTMRQLCHGHLLAIVGTQPSEQ